MPAPWRLQPSNLDDCCDAQITLKAGYELFQWANHVVMAVVGWQLPFLSVQKQYASDEFLFLGRSRVER